MKKLKTITILLSIALFLFSLTKECYCTKTQCADSLMVFLIGWAGIAFAGAGLTWLANPLIILSWLFAKRNSKYALPISFLATLICFSFLLFGEVIANEAGHYHAIIAYKAGYWLWSASASVMFIGILLTRQLPAGKK